MTGRERHKDENKRTMSETKMEKSYYHSWS